MSRPVDDRSPSADGDDVWHRCQQCGEFHQRVVESCRACGGDEFRRVRFH